MRTVDDIMAEFPSCVCGEVFDETNPPLCFITIENDDAGIKMFACSKECVAKWLQNTKDKGLRHVRPLSQLPVH